MKCLFAFLLCAAAGSAADFTTGQAARLVIGQETFTSQIPGASDTLVGGVSGLAYANDTLFVADSNRVSADPSNHRVLLFRNLSSMLPKPTDALAYDRKCPACLGQASAVLGQPDFTTATENLAATKTGLRLPTAVASDGVRLAVADTNHNRVLIWNSIPTTNNAPADVVVGQPDFTSAGLPGNVPNAKSLRGPQGVWITRGKLYIADTQNHRVMVYNQIPTTNGVAADVVLGQPNFTTYVEPDLTQQKTDAQPGSLLNPVAVTSDGVKLFVTDLGYNRVLIWNSIPTSNGQPADVAVGQPDLTSSISNYSYKTDTAGNKTQVLCASIGTDSDSKPVYPPTCNATLSFPRFALSDGTRLFVADGGNDRVLVFNHIPTQSGALADYVIGQIGGTINQASDAADSLRTPMSLAWDGTNLFVSDAFNRRITVYSMAETKVPYTGVRNAASFAIYAVGSVTFTGTPAADDTVTLTVRGTDYKYTVKKDDTFTQVVKGLTDLINAGSGDPYVFAQPNLNTFAVMMTSRLAGEEGNNIDFTVAVNDTATITTTTSGATLSGGGDAAKIGPGSAVSIIGSDLAGASASADVDAVTLPYQLAGTEVYFNGIRAPLFSVSPTQINAQIPFEFTDTTSVNAYVRSVRDGNVVVTTPVAVTIVTQNPGIFTLDQAGQDPRPGVVLHGSSYAMGAVSVDGSYQKGDVATVTIEDRTYTHTVVEGDTLASVRDDLVSKIDQDPKVHAFPSGSFTRIRLQARVQGPEGNGITYGGSANADAQIVITATGAALCCANVAYAPVTTQNPAVPGETLIVYATGLGLPIVTDDNKDWIKTGVQYPVGGPVTEPVNFVSSLAGGKTANVFSASLKGGTVGTYEVILELNSDIPTNDLTQLTIAQDIFVSNIVTIPVYNPIPAVQ